MVFLILRVLLGLMVVGLMARWFGRMVVRWEQMAIGDPFLLFLWYWRHWCLRVVANPGR